MLLIILLMVFGDKCPNLWSTAKVCLQILLQKTPSI